MKSSNYQLNRETMQNIFNIILLIMQPGHNRWRDW